VTLVAMIVVTARIDLRLAAVAMSVSPVLFLLSRSFGPRLRKNWKEIKQLDSSAMGVVQEVLSAVRVVKAFGREDRSTNAFSTSPTGASAASSRCRRFRGASTCWSPSSWRPGARRLSSSACSRCAPARSVWAICCS